MRVLVTGASGYVGSRLIPHLRAQGYEVSAAMRSPEKAEKFAWHSEVDVVEMDADDAEQVHAALVGVDVAYYLLHSMDADGFADADRRMATAFADAAGRAGVGRIVYLGGLVPAEEELSEHLGSRLEVEEVLMASEVPVVIALRAGIVLGGGSTSFELLRRLVERLPVIPLPTYLNARLQPVSIADALAGLVAAATEPAESTSIDLVGPEVLSYRELIEMYADVAKLKRLTFTVPPVPYAFLSGPGTVISQMPWPTVKALIPSLGEDLIGREGHTCRDRLSALGKADAVGVREAMVRSLGSAEGEREPDDDHDLRYSDPQWAGGQVELHGGRRVRTGDSWWSRLAGTSRRS